MELRLIEEAYLDCYDLDMNAIDTRKWLSKQSPAKLASDAARARDKMLAEGINWFGYDTLESLRRVGSKKENVTLPRLTISEIDEILQANGDVHAGTSTRDIQVYSRKSIEQALWPAIDKLKFDLNVTIPDEADDKIRSLVAQIVQVVSDAIQ